MSSDSLSPAESIRELRAKLNITQATVAKHWGKSESLLSRFESGERIPSVAELNAIKKAIMAAASTAPRDLTPREREVWDELEAIRPKQTVEPPLRDRVRLVRLFAKLRSHGIGGAHGLTVQELTKVALLLDRFRMSPVGRGVVFEKLTQITL